MSEHRFLEMDLGYYSTEIIKDKEGNSIVIIKFKNQDRPSWVKGHSWCPTLAELEFIYNTKKMIDNNSSKIKISKTPAQLKL